MIKTETDIVVYWWVLLNFKGLPTVIFLLKYLQYIGRAEIFNTFPLKAIFFEDIVETSSISCQYFDLKKLAVWDVSNS